MGVALVRLDAYRSGAIKVRAVLEAQKSIEGTQGNEVLRPHPRRT